MSTPLTTAAPAQYSEAEWAMRVDLAACYHLADRYGFSKIVWNHITARIPGSEHFLINRFGLRYNEITASNLVKLDLDGNIIDGPPDINVTGFVIHSAIHQARQDVVCVMHAHSPKALAVSALESGLLPMTQEAMMFYNRTGYHDYEGLSTDTNERERLAASLGDAKAMLMRNHGAMTVGETVGEAFSLMLYLEMACEAQIDVLATGQKWTMPPPEVCEKAARQHWEEDYPPGQHEWPALLRELDESGAQYAA